jgi:hypothetical protein
MNKIIELNNFNINLEILLVESENIMHLLEDKINPYVNIVVQKKFHIIRNNITSHILMSMPYTRKIINKILDNYNFKDITYRELQPGTVYNWHYDQGQFCIHIPLITNEGCFFIYENENYRLQVGKVYYINNGLMHTFCNAGISKRLHLTFENL